MWSCGRLIRCRPIQKVLAMYATLPHVTYPLSILSPFHPSSTLSLFSPLVSLSPPPSAPSKSNRSSATLPYEVATRPPLDFEPLRHTLIILFEHDGCRLLDLRLRWARQPPPRRATFPLLHLLPGGQQHGRAVPPTGQIRGRPV